MTDLIEASRQEFEHDTQSLTSQRQVTEEQAVFPSPDWRFYWRPPVAVTTINYFDESNNIQTLPTSVYSVDYPGRRILLNDGQSWPTTANRWDAVKIEYDAGFLVSEMPETVKAAIKLKLNQLFELRGLAPNQTTEYSERSYEMMVTKYARSNYP